jgi:hypothetical protein
VISGQQVVDHPGIVIRHLSSGLVYEGELAMAVETVIDLLKQVPGPDNQSLRQAEDVERFEAVIDQLLQSEPPSVPDLVAQLRPASEPSAEDAKARFVLHAMAARVGGAGGRPSDEDQRRRLAEQLALTLSNELPAGAAQFVVERLQWCGGSEVVEALSRLLGHDDPQLADAAARAMLSIGDGAEERFRAALPESTGQHRQIVQQNLDLLTAQKSK